MTTNDVSPEILQAIWNAHGLGKIEQLIQPPQDETEVDQTLPLILRELDWLEAHV